MVPNLTLDHYPYPSNSGQAHAHVWPGMKLGASEMFAAEVDVNKTNKQYCQDSSWATSNLCVKSLKYYSIK